MIPCLSDFTTSNKHDTPPLQSTSQEPFYCIFLLAIHTRYLFSQPPSLFTVMLYPGLSLLFRSWTLYTHFLGSLFFQPIYHPKYPDQIT
ncbi:hypothetical protein BDW67DRAFT_54345 [Aspergillus spinulosporus]